MRIKHNKLRNTGILFELLLRQVTSDTIAGKDSNALTLIRKYFSKTEIAKEHKIYQTLINSKQLNESRAITLIENTLGISSRLNKTSLKREKYNLIKDIRENYNIEDFFKSKINNYTQYAAIYSIVEAHNSQEFIDPSFIDHNKTTILEHISNKVSTPKTEEDPILKEYTSMDKGSRLMIYRILLEKFNSKYNVLSNKQKHVLKEYITNSSNTAKLREFINENYISIKNELLPLIKKVDDKTTQIKLKEVVNLLNPLDKKDPVKDEYVVSLLQYYQLIDDLKGVK